MRGINDEGRESKLQKRKKTKEMMREDSKLPVIL
jgi:hypothetical protein